MTPWRQANRMRTVLARLPSASSVPGRRARGPPAGQEKAAQSPVLGIPAQQQACRSHLLHPVEC